MKTLYKKYTYDNKGTGSVCKGWYKGSSPNITKHPYLRKEFWCNPLNQFWNSAMYSKESKEYYNDWVNKMA